MKTHPIALTLFSALLLASCGSKGPQRPEGVATISAASPSSANQLANDTLHHVNNFRAAKGLPRLQVHSGLEALALEHSEAMLRRGDMSHFDFEKRAKVAQKKYQMGAVSENLHNAWGVIPSGATISNQWANSPKHLKNMSGRFTHAGVAIAQEGTRIYTTLLLGGHSSQATLPGSGPGLIF